MKDYLGDGVYVEEDMFGSITLTTENGILVTNKICIEPAVEQAFLNYLTKRRK